MKKFLVVLVSLLILIPTSASASKIVGSSIIMPNTVTQGEEFTADVIIYFEGLGIDEMKMLAILEFEVIGDKNMFIVESISASNFQASYGTANGKNWGHVEADVERINENTDLSKNLMSNTFTATLTLFAKGSGTTNFGVGEVNAIVGDISKGENVTEEDMELLSFNSDGSNVDVLIKPSSVEIEVPEETTEVIPKSEIKQVPTITVPKTTATSSTTTKVTTTKTEESTTSSSKEDEDKIKEDQEKRKKINKKIISYVAIGLVIIILLVIANAIINKIRNRKIDKMLKKM